MADEAQRQFPVLLGGRYDDVWRELGIPRYVSWDLLSPHEKQAKKNHSQSLETLARRGGLGPVEMLAVLTDREYQAVRDLTHSEAWAQLKELITPFHLDLDPTRSEE